MSRPVNVKVWHADKNSDDPPLGICVVTPYRAKMFRFPKWFRAWLGREGIRRQPRHA